MLSFPQSTNLLISFFLFVCFGHISAPIVSAGAASATAFHANQRGHASAHVKVTTYLKLYLGVAVVRACCCMGRHRGTATKKIFPSVSCLVVTGGVSVQIVKRALVFGYTKFRCVKVYHITINFSLLAQSDCHLL